MDGKVQEGEVCRLLQQKTVRFAGLNIKNTVFSLTICSPEATQSQPSDRSQTLPHVGTTAFNLIIDTTACIDLILSFISIFIHYPPV